MSFFRHRRANPGRQLSGEETRVYAAGMAAAKRGEFNPKEHLPEDQFAIWRMGWNRANATYRNYNGYQSRVVNPKHLIKTEVDDFDDALRILAAQRKSAKISEALTGKRKMTAEQLVKLAQKTKRDISLGGDKLEQPAFIDEKYEASLRMIERIRRATDSMKFGLEEMQAVSGKSALKVDHKYLVDLINKLCFAAGLAGMTLECEVRPSAKARERLCANCGCELVGSGILRAFGLVCEDCADTGTHRASNERRQQESNLKHLERDARSLGRIINQVHKRVKR